MTSNKLIGILLAIFGGLLAFGGFSGSGTLWYFVISGIGILLSGVLVFLGKQLGVYVYLATYLIMLIWSVIEVGANPIALFYKLAMPTLIGGYLYFSDRVQDHLQ